MQVTYVTAAYSCERWIDQDVVRRFELRDRSISKFDLVLSLEDEREILRLWGLAGPCPFSLRKIR